MKSGHWITVLALGLLACSSTRMVRLPSRVSVDPNWTVGLVRFEVEGANPEDHNVTGRFLEAFHEGQPGVAVVELGDVGEVLKAVGLTELNGEAVRAIGEKHDLDAVITGRLQLAQTRPEIGVDFEEGLRVNSVSARVRLHGTLAAKMLDTARGATVWTGSSTRWITLASGGGTRTGLGSVNLPDIRQQYEELIHDLIREATEDFRPTWEEQPK